ncbi:hypothetical protein Avbf_06745 [Armadillidium vulgare]|nr:hypothetical protein Avbf_06745 [Armadillidium vulgare]
MRRKKKKIKSKKILNINFINIRTSTIAFPLLVMRLHFPFLQVYSQTPLLDKLVEKEMIIISFLKYFL